VCLAAIRWWYLVQVARNRVEVSRTGEVNCPFEYGSWDQFWPGTRGAGPTQLAIGLVGLDAVERATRRAVEPLTAEDGSITFDTNVFIYVVGQARILRQATVAREHLDIRPAARCVSSV
jgi:hypothetical protein